MSVEVLSNQNILDWASQSDVQRELVATAAVQRLLNLRQQLSEQKTPDPDEVNVLDTCVTRLSISTLYEALRAVDIPPFYRYPHRSDSSSTTFKDDDRDWQGLARCNGVDPEIFFPERGASGREAKKVCESCVVRKDCLEFAIDTSQKFGIWGGLSERERRIIRRERLILAGSFVNPLLSS